MKLAVISDTHDHLENTVQAIERINEQGAEKLIHCGDLCSPFVIDRLSKFNGEVHVVFGNNDGDRFTITRVASKFDNLKIHGETGISVFFGHTHKHVIETVNGVPFVNPGELMGLLEKPGWVLFDTENGAVQHFEL